MSSSQLYPYWLGQNPPPNPYASIHSDTTQKVSAANTATALTFDAISPSYAITVSGSRVIFQVSGVYRFAYSIQLATTSGGIQTAYCFLKKNGVIIPNSGNFTSTPNNGASDVALSDILSVVSGDYIEIFLYSSDANMAATAYPAIGIVVPASPSVALEVNKIN